MEKTGEWQPLIGALEYRVCGEYQNEVVEVRRVGTDQGTFFDQETLSVLTHILEEKKNL